MRLAPAGAKQRERLVLPGSGREGRTPTRMGFALTGSASLAIVTPGMEELFEREAYKINRNLKHLFLS